MSAIVLALACLLEACTAQIPCRPDARYVWLCSVVSGASCGREQIRCWGVRERYWVDDDRCAEFERPEALVTGQSYPLVPGSVLFPYRGRAR